MSKDLFEMCHAIDTEASRSRHGWTYCRSGSPALSDSEPCVVTIGAFDGVHRGHRSLVESALEDARGRGVRCVAVTFDPDPADVVGPSSMGTRLMRMADRRDTLLRLGVDSVVVVSFTADVARLEPQAFVDDVLLRTMRAVCVHVGSNFRFGRHGAGDVDVLAALGAQRGFDVTAHELLDASEEHISSTRIRQLLRSSRLEEANDLLGHWHFVRGTVLHGRGEGTSFGFPTANVECEPMDCLPAEGVYACYVVQGNLAWPAAANVGAPPTFAEARPAFLEANLIGFGGDLYGAEVTVLFVKWLRASREFDSLRELEKEVLANISWVRHNLGSQALEV